MPGAKKGFMKKGMRGGGKVPGMKEYVAEFTSEKTWGEEGYLADRGLIPMPDAERKKFRTDGAALNNLSM